MTYNRGMVFKQRERAVLPLTPRERWILAGLATVGFLAYVGLAALLGSWWSLVSWALPGGYLAYVALIRGGGVRIGRPG